MSEPEDIHELLENMRQFLSERKALDNTDRLVLLNTVNTALLLSNQQRFSSISATKGRNATDYAG
jgi:hypothetical protein